MWIYFVGGHNKEGKLVAVAIGMAKDPETEVAKLEGSWLLGGPIRLLGEEKGSRERLEQLKERFKGLHSNGVWYKAATGIMAHIAALEPVDRDTVKPRRVSLDLSAPDFQELEDFVQVTDSTTKQRFLRRAYKGYGRLGQYVAQGFKIQAIKDGRLVQFDNLDHIPEP